MRLDGVVAVPVMDRAAGTVWRVRWSGAEVVDYRSDAMIMCSVAAVTSAGPTACL